MLGFLRQAAAGVGVMIATFSGLALAATLSADPADTRRPSTDLSDDDASIRALRQRGMMLQQVNEPQPRKNMATDAMGRSVSHRQEMIRSQR